MTKRAFFAINLPEESKQAVESIIIDLQKNIQNELIRWVRIQNLHVTLQFLPAVQSTDIELLLKNVKTELTQAAPFKLALGQLEFFPTDHHAKIISLGVQPNETLADLSKLIGKGIISSGYAIETRPYRGHLTLCRLNNFHLPDDLFAKIKLPDHHLISVSEVVLYESKPTKAGSEYIPVAHLKL